MLRRLSGRFAGGSNNSNNKAKGTTITSGNLINSLTSATNQTSSTSSASSFNEQETNVGDMQGKNEAEIMQRKTFRRWVNKYLARKDLTVNHIIDDWENGVLLINLLEVLSQSSFAKYNKTPKLKLHSLENLNTCIAFMKSNNIQLVNVGSEDVYQHNPTIVMGLIWQLILKYSLAAGKAEVLAWCKRRLEPFSLGISNFTEDFQNGLLFAAIVASQCPEQLNFASLSKDDPMKIMDEAFRIADQYLEVSRLLDPADVMKNPDEKSILSYVGEIYSAIENPRPPRPVPQPGLFEMTNITTCSLQVNWSPVPGAINMKVQLQEASDNEISDWVENDPVQEQILEYTKTSALFENLLPDKLYRVRGIAMSPRLESQPGPCLSEKTLAQGAPIASDIGFNSCKISWQPYPTATSYKLELRLSSDQFWANARIIDVTSSSTTACVVDQLLTGTEYECRLIACTPTGNSDPSNACSIETLVEVPKKPIVSQINDNGFTIQWSACYKAEKYIVQVKGTTMDEKENVSWEEAMSVSVYAPNTSCIIGHLVPGETYLARVQTCTDIAYSFPSEEATVTTTMNLERHALLTGADVGSGCGLILQLLNQNASGRTSWEQGFSKVFVVSEYPSGALLKLVREKSPRVILLQVDFKDPETILAASKKLAKESPCITLCINNANLPLLLLQQLLGGSSTTI